MDGWIPLTTSSRPFEDGICKIFLTHYGKSTAFPRMTAVKSAKPRRQSVSLREIFSTTPCMYAPQSYNMSEKKGRAETACRSNNRCATILFQRV
ncbi:hypothetical protein KIN20_032885 [Parelaphostrongylus tenuis]|uniref:Uncharacterized protein n=1 Tax=Parelaphostrongylus tenuis TaxID=148309 RepID=A0AAD5R7P4_PARTN|nr:hypothetical protein KIN20_032885 [Parelaphostrongylus tenuis]